MAIPSEVTGVKMDDGRVVGFGKRQKLDKEILFRDGFAYAVRFNFRDGASITLDLSKVPVEIGAHLVAHGASQKCGDECADLDSVADMFAAVEAMIERLTSGNWSAERQGFAGQSILIEALIEVTGQTREQVREVLKTLTAKERAALKTDKLIKPVYDRIETERAKDVNTGDLLAKFQS